MIYFIQPELGGPIKIGLTNTTESVKRRLGELQVGRSDKLVIRSIEEGGKAREAELHKQFEKWRIRGEWFQPCWELCDRCGGVGDEVREAFEKGARQGHREGWNEGYQHGLEEARAETANIRERNEQMRLDAQARGRVHRDSERRFSAMLMTVTTREEREAYYESASPRDVPAISGIEDDERLDIIKAAWKTKGPA